MPELPERPVIFAAESICAILSGTKTQSRRVMNPQPPSWCREFGFTAFTPRDSISGRGEFLDEGPAEKFFRLRYGNRGDRLWVKETWRPVERESDAVDGVLFAADDKFVPIANTIAAAELWCAAHNNGRHGPNWRPSIYLPRWASRITLEITEMRVERVQAISEDDAKAEGVTTDPQQGRLNGKPATLCPMTHKQAFAWLWDAINGKRAGCAWRDNPWCFVISFKVVQGA